MLKYIGIAIVVILVIGYFVLNATIYKKSSEVVKNYNAGQEEVSKNIQSYLNPPSWNTYRHKWSPYWELEYPSNMEIKDNPNWTIRVSLNVPIQAKTIRFMTIDNIIDSDSKDLLEAFKNQYKSTSAPAVKNQKNVTINNYPGISFESSADGRNYIYWVLFDTKKYSPQSMDIFMFRSGRLTYGNDAKKQLFDKILQSFSMPK